jgi:hypothetical protein
MEERVDGVIAKIKACHKEVSLVSRTIETGSGAHSRKIMIELRQG